MKKPRTGTERGFFGSIGGTSDGEGNTITLLACTVNRVRASPRQEPPRPRSIKQLGRRYKAAKKRYFGIDACMADPPRL